jgi:hypothetical protein
LAGEGMAEAAGVGVEDASAAAEALYHEAQGVTV